MKQRHFRSAGIFRCAPFFKVTHTIIPLLILISFLVSACTGSDDADLAEPGELFSAHPADGSGDTDDNLDDDSDDDGNVFPSYPDNHEAEWNCYLCHDGVLYSAKAEPHDHTFDSPEQCTACHQNGAWSFTDPNAPADHGSADDCLNCHATQHERQWTDMDQCFACHARGEVNNTFPNGHEQGWDCYICHTNDFLGAEGEPHAGQYSAPGECLTCHSQGSWTYTNPDAPADHASTEDCLNCHQGYHGKTWGEADQCFACHQQGTGPSTFPTGHGAGWNCYICHDADFYDAQGEPHGGDFSAPSECLTCHSQGSWTYTDTDAPEGHGSTTNCLNCHQGMHGKTWTDQQQCLVCHLPGTSASTFPTGHGAGWNCYICHAADFYDAQGEPHGGQFTAPAECLTCHSQGSWSFTDPDAPEDHGSTSNCLNCHQGMHGKTWTDKNQCFTCHQVGTAAPQYPVNHTSTWNCYLCHTVYFRGSPGEPHGHQYTSPTQCVACHTQGSFQSPQHGPDPEDDHTPSWNCLTCHSGMHGKTWTDKNQCIVCHQF